MSKVSDIRKSPSTVVQVELGGKIRTIRFDLNAFAELETRFGTIQEAMNQLAKGGMKDVRTILWIGLIHEEVELDEVTGEPIKYNITAYQVGSWIDPSNMPAIMDKLGEAITGDLPTPTKAEPVKQEAEAVVPTGVKMAVVEPEPADPN